MPEEVTACQGVTFSACTSVRAKFFVKTVEVYSVQPPSRKIVLAPVYSQDPLHENKAFWDATPSGEISMTINNPRAAEFFKPGQEYYIDFSIPVFGSGTAEAIVSLPSVTT